MHFANPDDSLVPWNRLISIRIVSICILLAGLQSCGVTGVAPVAPVPEALYITDNGALQVLKVDPNTGAVQPLDSAVFPDVASGMTADPKSHFLYVSDFNANSLYAFSIDANSAAVTPITGSPFPFPGGSIGNGGALAMDPKGRFVFFSTNTGKIAIFLINSTGSLTPSPGTPSDFPITDEIIVEPSGHFLYTAQHEFPQFWAYSIDESTGSLTPVSGSPFTFTTTAGGGPGALAVVGNHLYGPFSNPNGIVSLNINQTTGALTETQGSPFANQYSGISMASDPAGKFLYIGNFNVGSISAYTIDASSGALTELNSSPYLGLGPAGLAVDPSGKFLFVSQTAFQRSQILAFSIDPTGALSPGPTFTLPASNASGYVVVLRLR